MTAAAPEPVQSLNMHKDKRTEYLRYDARAQSILTSERFTEETPQYGSLLIPLIYRAPYLYYEQCLNRYIKADQRVLELGAGTGMHTYGLVRTGARVVASDISSHALKVLRQRVGPNGERLMTLSADMEVLPFREKSFDVIACAGSLSYGDPDLVDKEIKRVLKPTGIFICVDSLNHNPVYRLNRWFHYLRGSRTKSTLLRMPTIERIRSISRGFNTANVRYFGAISYLAHGLSFIMGQTRAAKLVDIVDRLVKVRKSAFKFVLVALGYS